jgi:acetyl esterase/lipase
MKRMARDTSKNAIALCADEGAPDTEIWTHATNGETWIRNVSHPSVTPFLPKLGASNGAAVLVIPGGGFQFISISNEGWPVAQWLADRGVAAFVLTYRTELTPDDEAAFGVALEARFKDIGRGAPPDARMVSQTGIAAQDAQAAMKLIRDRAADWGVDTARIGMLGFSAGAMTMMASVETAKPAFIGNIYGPMTAVVPPSEPPPMFVSMASDDPLFAGQGFDLIENWQRAGGAVELHYYEGGGHGFGSHNKGTTSDLWFEQFVAWMGARAVLAE